MPRDSSCWPGTDLDGFTEFNPPAALLTAYWNAELLDTNGVPSDRIIRVSDPFDVRFRVELVGPAWHCMAGDWVFDVRLDERGGPEDFKLSSKLPANALSVVNWKGCEVPPCIELKYTVPATSVPEAVYELTATMRLHCCGRPGPVVGFDQLGEYQWYQ